MFKAAVIAAAAVKLSPDDAPAGELVGNVPVAADAALHRVAWGLDVIDQRALPPDNKKPRFARNGTGIVVYSLDTGLNCNMLSGFANCTVDAAADAQAGGGNRCACDRHGHGTAMAQLVSLVAFNATLVGVPVLDAEGRGSLAQVLWGIRRAAEIHAANFTAGTLAVVLAPLSSDPIQPENRGDGSVAHQISTAISELATAGIVFVTSAGNKGINACSVSPALAPAAVTVAAMTSGGRRAYFSNWGACVDVFAPADAAIFGEEYSGTSVSAGYAAGVAANVAAVGFLTAPQAAATMLANASTFSIDERKGEPDRHVYAPRGAHEKHTAVTPSVFRKIALAAGVVTIVAASIAGIHLLRLGALRAKAPSREFLKRVSMLRFYGTMQSVL